MPYRAAARREPKYVTLRSRYGHVRIDPHERLRDAARAMSTRLHRGLRWLIGLTALAALGAAAPLRASAPPPVAPPSNAQCLACHAAGLMGAPKINPTVLAHSVHGTLSCVSCHAGIRTLPHPPLVPAVTCATCHQRQGRELALGSHAALAQARPGERPRPTCTTCHGTHDITRVSSPTFRQHLTRTCATCHARAYRSYMSTPHGQAAALGLQRAPRCVDCHNPHRALAAHQAGSELSGAHRTATCARCHAGASTGLAGYDPHPQPDSPARSRLLAYTHYFMVALLAGVFGFFGLHTLLWLQRSLIARLRGELPPLAHFSGPHIQRFTVVDRLTHLIVILSFMLLSLTGLALMHPTTGWGEAISGFFGGPARMRVIHLVNGGITFGYFLFHLLYLAYRAVVKKQHYALFGSDSLVPNTQDLRDIWRNFRWFLYLGRQPRMGRWTYWEKFDYWAVFWGVAMIGVSGLMLAAPVFFTHFMPGIILNVAFIVHSEEALLATGFIFIFHFFHNHFRPEKFPIDVSILTGRVPLERFKEERPLQYETLVREGKLQAAIVAPPSKGLVVISVLFGLAVVVTGVTLIALVIFVR